MRCKGRGIGWKLGRRREGEAKEGGRRRKFRGKIRLGLGRRKKRRVRGRDHRTYNSKA